MTVDRRRRRRAVWGAAAGVAVGLAAVVGIGNAGRVAILNTTDGDLQGHSIPEDRFPHTTITALAVADDDGWLASLALLVGAPDDAAGGTIVVVPVNADTTNGYGDERRPLDAVAFAADAPVLTRRGGDDATTVADTAVATAVDTTEVREAVGDRLAEELPLMLGVSIDEVLVLDAAQLGADIEGIGGSAELAIALATRPAAPVLAAFPGQVEAWRTLLAGPLEAVSSSDWTSLFAGEVAVAALSPQLPAVSVRLDGADVSFLDRAEIVTLFAHIAPTRVAAPNAGFNFRIVSGLGDEQLDGTTRYDLAYLATARLLAADHNVLSVDTAAGTAGAVTLVEVDDDTLLTGAAAFESLFGPVEVRRAERRIVGVDVIVTLGTGFVPIAADTEVVAAPSVAELVAATMAESGTDSTTEPVGASTIAGDITSTTEEVTDD